MAMLASKSSFPASLASTNATLVSSAQPSSMAPTRRAPAVHAAGQVFASPTESEFSDVDGPDAVKNWSEDQVCEYLRSVKCGEYEKLFRKNNVNGENLLEMDKEVLKEMGIDKVGDRVRLFLGIKKLRTKAYANQKRRNRDSFGGLDSQYTPSSTGSPRPFNSGSRGLGSANKRYSRQIDMSSLAMNSLSEMGRPGSRPTSPLPNSDARGLRQQRYQQAQPYMINTSNSSGRGPGSPTMTGRLVINHTRNASSQDGSLMAALPQGQDVIRVISTGGVTKVVKIADCSNCEEVMRVTLRKFALREDHDRNYCFWVLAGVDPDPKQSRRLGDTELWRIVKDQKRPERNRLILRRVPSGEPGEAELQRAASIAMEEAQQSHARALENVQDKRSQLKVQKLLGESWNEGLQQPLSPISFQDRERNLHNAARDLERPASNETKPPFPRRKGLLRQFGGLRPPSELITSDLTSYFPDHPREDIDRTARLSMRRSTRLSKVNSRLSVASNLSFASSIQDAPPIPTIADSWLSGGQLAKVRAREIQGRMPHGFRDSVASSVLDTLQEESPIEPNRKSYVSFADSSSDSNPISITDPEGHARQSYFDETSTQGSGSLKEITQALSEDGEDADEELQSFLAGESWDDNKWMKGALIGQGSFGSVYLALHAVTGELLAVKQVETPSPGANSATDARKKSMIEALKREIGLLRDLRHANIVQYLGCSSTAEHLNIFLEYVPGGSVQTMLNSYGALPEPLVRSFVRQILQGLSYLHNRDIIHRDIKGANILVDNKGTIKISDFGISKKLEASNILSGANNNKHRPSLQGSVFWMAPEVVKQTSYTRKADIWSLGCLVVEMMTGTHPFPDCSQLQAIFKIGGGKAAPTIPDNASIEAQTFLSQTFEIDHNLRPSADELMLSPFLAPIT
ncbi:kinase-like domain-containing protein [Annulohypoxylon maeteangense]|uniref:kinase-like domain-containing protein n=1 Tax=Annulohypoxylon maeteangense TaxID=1927788 RepID=UPI0020087B1C|nr:kinase-like domain-containing protein [Annulohypoxylon maeteangense]KAI0887206.1 kinase-like domain-containing protein [Annulohypoxylon maeteangense]